MAHRIHRATRCLQGVLVINKPDLPESGAGEFIKASLIVAVALALHAVAYTGWAAAGLPKMLIDVNAETAFEADTQQACYSLARLRVGITCGALTALVSHSRSRRHSPEPL